MLEKSSWFIELFSYAFFSFFKIKKCCCVLSLEKTAPTHHQIVYFHFVFSRFIDKCLNYEQIRQDTPNMYNNLNWWYSSSSSEDYQIRCQLLHLKDFLRFFFIGNVNKWRKKYIWINEEKVLLGILNREKKYVWRTFKVIYSMRKLTDIDILVKCTASFPIEKKSLQNNFEHRTITRIIHNQS